MTDNEEASLYLRAENEGCTAEDAMEELRLGRSSDVECPQDMRFRRRGRRRRGSTAVVVVVVVVVVVAAVAAVGIIVAPQTNSNLGVPWGTTALSLPASAPSHSSHRSGPKYGASKKRGRNPESDGPPRDGDKNSDAKGPRVPQRRQTPRMRRDTRRNESIRSGRNPLLSLNLNLDALASAVETTTPSPSEGATSTSIGELAQELYVRISALYQEGYYAVPPDIVSFNSVLKAWRDDPVRALEFWESELVPRLEDDVDDEVDTEGSWFQKRNQERRPRRRRAPLLEPNVRSYNTFLWALARAGMHQQAEMLLESMKHPQSLVGPDRITYNTVLLSYYNARVLMSANSEDDDLPDRSLRLLDEMLASAPPHLTPDAVTFNTVLAVLSTVGTVDAAQQAEELLGRMRTCGVEPDVYTYTAVIQSWASIRHGDICGASKRARAVLEKMQRSNVAPNAVTYTLVMQSLCRANKPRAATSLLNEMIDRAVREEAKAFASDSSRDVIEAVARPDVVTFSALMDGWARWMKNQSAVASPEKRKEASNEAVRAVLTLLSQMKDLRREWSEVAPNEQTYTSVLATIANSRHPASGQRAERLMDDMTRMGLVPTTVHWNAALDSHAKSPRIDKVRLARTAWAKMVRAKVEPDVVTYNTLLASAASTRSDVDDDIQRDCVRTGLQALALLQRDPHVRPTSLTFHYVFKIMGRFLPTEPALASIAATATTNDAGGTSADPHRRRSVVRAAFRLCCDSGCLNDVLLRQLREHVFVPGDGDDNEDGGEERWIMEDHVPDWRPNMGLSDLPPSWSWRGHQKY